MMMTAALLEKGEIEMHAVECDHPVVALRKKASKVFSTSASSSGQSQKNWVQDQTIILPAAAADQIAEMIFRGETGGLDIHKKGVFVE